MSMKSSFRKEHVSFRFGCICGKECRRENFYEQLEANQPLPETGVKNVRNVKQYIQQKRAMNEYSIVNCNYCMKENFWKNRLR